MNPKEGVGQRDQAGQTEETQQADQNGQTESNNQATQSYSFYSLFSSYAYRLAIAPMVGKVGEDKANKEEKETNKQSKQPTKQTNKQTTNQTTKQTTNQPNKQATKPPNQTSQKTKPPTNQNSWYSARWGPAWFTSTEEKQPTEPEPELTKPSKLGGGWAFFTGKRQSLQNKGELAIAETETQTEPREATFTPAKIDKTTQRESIVVPSLESVYTSQSQSARIFSRLSNLGLKHTSRLYRTQPANVKNVVVIGVHGYFPARMTRAILGEPTGTSIRFANFAETAVNNWAKRTGSTVEIEKIALEGEGRINHRVDTLLRLLLNWRETLSRADAVLFACHSQGMVVSVQILAKLLESGVLTKYQRIGLLGMAGTFLGPMAGLDKNLVMRAITKIEHDSLVELFELQKIDSAQSLALLTALRVALTHGVKMSLVGSADDQLVPLYSALCSHISHPNIFRSVYIDGEDLDPQVVAPLLDLALRRRNSGHSDHGVLSEISSVIAGALTGKGHSKLYNCESIYDTFVTFCLETTNSTNDEPTIDAASQIPRGNPYILPWAVHELVSESTSSGEYADVLQELHEDYKDWRPPTRSMKELKWRLAGLQRSQL